jgi:hypothetical protein
MSREASLDWGDLAKLAADPLVTIGSTTVNYPVLSNLKDAAALAMAEEAGFASAASAIPGVVGTEGRTSLYALPRIAWDGRQRSLRAMRVILSGITFPQAKPTRSAGF